MELIHSCRRDPSPPFASPIGGYVKGLTRAKRQRLMQLVKSSLPIDAQGVIGYAARVNAVRGSA